MPSIPTIHCYYFILVRLGLAVSAVVLHQSSPDDSEQFGSDSSEPTCFGADVSVICVFKPTQTNQMKRSIEPGLD